MRLSDGQGQVEELPLFEEKERERLSKVELQRATVLYHTILSLLGGLKNSLMNMPNRYSLIHPAVHPSLIEYASGASLGIFPVFSLGLASGR